MMSKALQDLSTSLRPPESPSVTVPPQLCSCHTSHSVFWKREAHVYFMPFGLIAFSSGYWPSGLWWSRWLDRQTSFTETLALPQPNLFITQNRGPCPNTFHYLTWLVHLLGGCLSPDATVNTPQGGDLFHLVHRSTFSTQKNTWCS